MKNKYKIEYIYFASYLAAIFVATIVSGLYGDLYIFIAWIGADFSLDRIVPFSIMLLSALAIIIFDFLGVLSSEVEPVNKSKLFWLFMFVVISFCSVWLFFAMECGSCRMRHDLVFYISLLGCPAGIFFPISMILKLVRGR